MTPSLQIATDNVYKFLCLFGLALIVVSIVSLVSTYTASLDRKIKYSEVVISLEANSPRSKVDEDRLEMNKKLIAVSKSNENFANIVLAFILVIGVVFSLIGFWLWYERIQMRDDKLAQLQLEKLQAEIAKLRADVASSQINPPDMCENSCIG